MTSPLEPGRYRTAAAFHTALEVRLREAAGGNPRALNLMRTQFTIGRLLARLELAQPGQWVAKGGTSLLSRFEGRCRLSRDLDVQRRQLHDAGFSGLTAAAAVDAGDWLNYRIDRTSPLRQEEIIGVTARVVATLNRRELARFDVDMVEEEPAAGTLSRRTPFLPIPLSGAAAPEVLLYPVEDHIADKVAAMGKTHSYGGVVVASTRYRDLADLALLAASLPVEAAPLLAALRAPARHWASEAFGRTGLRVPDPRWPRHYADTVRSEPFVADRWPTVDGALAAAKPLVDPALAGTATGRWDPATAVWRPAG